MYRPSPPIACTPAVVLWTARPPRTSQLYLSLIHILDAVEVAQRVGLGSHINTVLQAAFFQIAGLMPVEEALAYLKDAARKSYARKGDAVVAKNVAAIEEGAQKLSLIHI